MHFTPTAAPAFMRNRFASSFPLSPHAGTATLSPQPAYSATRALVVDSGGGLTQPNSTKPESAFDRATAARAALTRPARGARSAALSSTTAIAADANTSER